jgi:lipoate-protein ligase A
VLLSYDPELFERLLRLPLPKLQKHGASSLAARLTSLSWELGREPALEEVEEAIRDGLEEFLGISFVPAPLTSFEEGEIASLLPFFQSEVWIDGERKKARYSGEARLFFSGGTVACGVLLGGDPSSPVVREVFFSGDFFLQPPEALARLEASLKGCSREEAEARISSFFAFGAPEDGCGHAEFLAVFRAAVEEALKEKVSQ